MPNEPAAEGEAMTTGNDSPSSTLLSESAAMKDRNRFPLDLSVLLFPIPFLIVSLLMAPLFAIVNWLRHPTPSAWLWAVGIASCTAVFGTVVLFVAKLPQYRAGIFLRIGSQHLPIREQRLYLISWWLIVPSIFVLLVLYGVVHRFQ